MCIPEDITTTGKPDICVYAHTSIYICIRRAGETDGQTEGRRKKPNSCMYGLNNKIRGNTKLLYVIPKEQTERAGAGEAGTGGTVVLSSRDRLATSGNRVCTRSPSQCTRTCCTAARPIPWLPPSLRNSGSCQSLNPTGIPATSGCRSTSAIRALASHRLLDFPLGSPASIARRSPATPAQSERRF